MRSLYLLPLLAAVASAGHFTNEWAVTIDGDEAEAHRVARELNCVVKGEEGGYDFPKSQPTVKFFCSSSRKVSSLNPFLSCFGSHFHIPGQKSDLMILQNV